MANEQVSTRCCVVGGGPCGLMAGFLLARAGVDVVVLEKHPDFLRDFRGDTIHPSTMEVLAELGLLERFLALPHQAVKYVEGEFGNERVRVADFTHLPTRCKFIALMPQWDLLDFLAGEGKRLARFRLMMGAEATGLVRGAERAVGLAVTTFSGPLAI